MTLYVLFHCDEWKSYSSMRFIGVVDKEHLEKSLRKIKQEQGYTKEDMETYIYMKNIICITYSIRLKLQVKTSFSYQ